VLPISSLELVFKIGAASLRREEPSVWHGPAWASQGCFGEVFLGGRFFGEVGVAGSWRSDDDDTGEQPRRRPSPSAVCAVYVW
jgi:hypothetical protein